MTSSPRRLARLLLAAALLPACALAAEPNVRKVTVEVSGAGAVSEAYVLAHVSLRAGTPFSREAAADTVRTLYATGRFAQAEVIPVVDAASGQVDVRVVVEPRPLVASLRIEGLGGREDEADLIEDLGIKAGDSLDLAALARGRNKAIERLRKNRPFSTIDIRRKAAADGRVELVAVAKLSPSLRVSTVEIQGAEKISESELLEGAELKVGSWRWWKLSGLTGGGRLSVDDYRQDCEGILAFYRARGFLDVEIASTDAATQCAVRDISGDEGWVDVVFRIKEGKRYAFGQVQVTGNELGKDAASPFSTEKLLAVVGNRAEDSGLIASETDQLAPGVWYSAAAVEVAVDKLRAAYGSRGYLDVQIGVVRTPNLQTGAIDVRFEIREGTPSTVRQVLIEGNTKTRSTVVARELALAPGDTFDLTAARRTENRLRNTRFFESVRVTPAPTAVPEQRDLLIALKEGPTGMVSFGAGFSSVEQLVGFVEYSEGNFDAFNPEGWFRGGGQKFRLRVSAGNLSNSIEHSFEEPALWERDLAVGYNLYQRFSGYQSSYYDVQTRGFDVYARRNILGVQARLSAGARSVELSNVNAAVVPPDVLAESGVSKSIPELTLSLVRDTRDEFTFPTRGYRVALTNTYAGGGLGGDVDYLKTDLRVGKWFLISREATQTLSLYARAGTYQPNAPVPFYERQQLGGAYDLRGYKYNYVGSPDVFQTAPLPAAQLYQPVGGLSYGLLTAEYTIKASDTLRWAVFTDWGFVNSESNDFSPGQLNGDYGIGLRILLGGAVLRLDFGFPLSPTTVQTGTGPVKVNDDGMQLNFSFGTSF
ncbi:MAG: outer membrane protein assembly factor BamA [Opitutales bacterium]